MDDLDNATWPAAWFGLRSHSIALKILQTELCASREFKQRFDREVKSLAAVRHPNIVTIHSFEDCDGVTFYTMEYVDGESLASLTPKQGFSLDRIFRIAIPLTDAVAHAHTQGITHRDLKPANIMLDSDGRPRVLDFGLAKLADQTTTPDSETVRLSDLETGAGRILGTVAYMSPEQAEGKTADHRSDIFSLGIILYEMATGQRPFGGDTPVSTLSSIIKDTPTSIIDLQRQLPRHLWRIVKKCLEKDPGRRYQSAIDLRNDLEELKNEFDSGELIAPPPAAVVGSRRVRRSGLAVALAIIVVVAGITGYQALTRKDREPEIGTFPLVGAIDLTRSGKVEAADLSPDGKLMVYAERDENLSSLHVLQLATSRDVEILPPQTDEITSVRIGPAGDLVYFLDADRRALQRVSLLGGSPQRLFEDVDEFALAPDGRRLAVIRYEGDRAQILCGDITGGELTPLQEDVVTGYASYLDWSSDGESIVFNAFRESGLAEDLMRVSLAGDCRPLRGDRRWGHLDAISRLRDGSGLVVAAPRSLEAISVQQPSELWFVPASDAEPVMLTSDPFDYHSIGSDEQGNRLVAVQRQSSHAIWVLAVEDPAARRQVMYASRTGRWWLPLAWTPDRKIIYPALAGEAVHLWEVETDGSGRRRVTDGGTFNLCASVSPDGRTLAYCSNRAAGRIWIYLVDRYGGSPRRLTRAGEDEFFPDYSPDGQWIVYNIITAKRAFLRKTDVADGRTVDLGSGWAYMPCYSPDGSFIACVSEDTVSHDFKMSILAADDGRVLQTFPNEVSNYARIRWTPDGRTLVYNRRRNDADNLWLQSIDGGEPRRLTDFTSGRIAGFALSAKGDSLAVATLETERNVVMFEDYRSQIERAIGEARRD
jgi:Tol biopolymer transport system component